MSEIRPALTPEEWARAFEWRAEDPALSDSVFEDTTPEARHHIAALALHGQTFGFTWEDVDRLRNQATEHARVLNFPMLHSKVSEEDREWHRAELAAFDNLADRIAALLPPREPRP